MYPSGDVFGDMKDMIGVVDMMTGVKDTTGAEKEGETTKNGIRNQGGS